MHFDFKEAWRGQGRKALRKGKTYWETLTVDSV